MVFIWYLVWTIELEQFDAKIVKLHNFNVKTSQK